MAKAKKCHSWLFVAICGYKKHAGFCENVLNLIVKPFHCVYLEISPIFQFQFSNFDPLKAQYGQNM
jgi:hypothetical protein